MKLSDHLSIGCPKFTPPQHLSLFSRYWKVSDSGTCTQFPHNLIHRQWKITLMLKLQYEKKKSNKIVKDIFRSRLFLALLFCFRQFPPIKGEFITFVTQHPWEYKNVSLKGRFSLCPGSVQDSFQCILTQMSSFFFL